MGVNLKMNLSGNIQSVFKHQRHLQRGSVCCASRWSLCCFIRDYVQYWAARGVEVVSWTVNTAVEQQYYQQILKINYITDSLVEDCEPHY